MQWERLASPVDLACWEFERRRAAVLLPELRWRYKPETLCAILAFVSSFESGQFEQLEGQGEYYDATGGDWIGKATGNLCCQIE
jgi:hypothetical protein